jgi:hypothetical protein
LAVAVVRYSSAHVHNVQAQRGLKGLRFSRLDAEIFSTANGTGRYGKQDGLHAHSIRGAQVAPMCLANSAPPTNFRPHVLMSFISPARTAL